MKKWWHDKTIYQIYPKSFCDSNGDGIGDLRGIISKLDYLRDLGVDILWLSPCYKSPMVDQGYDISDYYMIDPMFGTMEDMECLIREAGNRDMYIIMDLVANHCSSEHPWFLEACKDPEGPYGRYFYIEDKGEKNPSNWRSYFGGSVWSTLPGHPDKVYYHSFHEKQPDLNWENPKVRAEIYKMINWWFDKGLAGFRIDAILNIRKRLPFCDYEADYTDGLCSLDRMLEDVNDLTEFLLEMKRETFDPHDAFTVAEVSGENTDRIPVYIGENGTFSSMFDFRELAIGAGKHGWFDKTEVTAEKYIQACFEAQRIFNSCGFPTNVIENHDNPRGVSRFIPPQDLNDVSKKMLGAINFFMRGVPCIYQGQELGMENYPFASTGEMDDVSALNEYRVAMEYGLSEAEALAVAAAYSRDNARTPMQWSGGHEAGFTEGRPWLAVNPNYEQINAEREMADPRSVYSFYREMLALRRDPGYRETLVYGAFVPLYIGDERVMAYCREGEKRILVVANYQGREAECTLPGVDYEVLLNNVAELRMEGNRIRLAPYQVIVSELRA